MFFCSWTIWASCCLSVRRFLHSQMFSLREREPKVPLLVLECECLWASLSQSHLLVYVCTLICAACDFLFDSTNQWMNEHKPHFSVLSVFVGYGFTYSIGYSALVFDWSFWSVWFIKGFETNKPLKEQWRFGRLSILTHKHIPTSTREWRRRHVFGSFLFYYYSNSPRFWLSNIIFEGWRKIFLVLLL